MSENFVPVKIHIKEHPEWFERFGAQWTPTLIVQGPKGKEQHRFEGYLPADDFKVQLELALAKVAFSEKRFEEAERRYLQIVERHPDSEVAPEALYWTGVSKYKASNNPASLQDTARAFKTKYADSSWAKKASVWGGN